MSWHQEPMRAHLSKPFNPLPGGGSIGGASLSGAGQVEEEGRTFQVKETTYAKVRSKSQGNEKQNISPRGWRCAFSRVFEAPVAPGGQTSLQSLLRGWQTTLELWHIPHQVRTKLPLAQCLSILASQQNPWVIKKQIRIKQRMESICVMHKRKKYYFM